MKKRIKNIIFLFFGRLSYFIFSTKKWYEFSLIKKRKLVFIDETFRFEDGCSFNFEQSEGSLSIGKSVQFRKNCIISVFSKGKVIIGDDVFVNNFCSMNCFDRIQIGNGTLIGEGVKIYDHNHAYSLGSTGNIIVHKDRFSIKGVQIGDNCWIGSNVTILKGVVIGDNVIIGANNLIYKSIPANVIVKAKTDFVIEEKGV